VNRRPRNYDHESAPPASRSRALLAGLSGDAKSGGTTNTSEPEARAFGSLRLARVGVMVALFPQVD
jgi:hypothetical protein